MVDKGAMLPCAEYLDLPDVAYATGAQVTCPVVDPASGVNVRRQLFEPRHREVRDTLRTVYNATTEHADHCSARPVSPAVHLNSIWFGSRAIVKVNAYKVAEECADTWNPIY